MTTEPKGSSAHVAHALHLKTLIARAREHLSQGEKVPDILWASIERTTDKMIETMPQ